MQLSSASDSRAARRPLQVQETLQNLNIRREKLHAQILDLERKIGLREREIEKYGRDKRTQKRALAALGLKRQDTAKLDGKNGILMNLDRVICTLESQEDAKAMLEVMVSVQELLRRNKGKVDAEEAGAVMDDVEKLVDEVDEIAKLTSEPMADGTGLGEVTESDLVIELESYRKKKEETDGQPVAVAVVGADEVDSAGALPSAPLFDPFSGTSSSNNPGPGVSPAAPASVLLKEMLRL